MSERKPGYYMIRYAHEQAPWEPAEWDGERWVLLGNSSPFSPATIGEIGPRIPTPDEPWQAVPVEPTRGMVEQGAQAIVSWDEGCTWPESWGSDAVRHRKDCRKAYRAMLAAAPNPEGKQ